MSQTKLTLIQYTFWLEGISSAVWGAMEAFVGKFERTEQKNYEEFLKVWTIQFVIITIWDIRNKLKNNKICIFLGFGREHTVEKGSIDLDTNHGGEYYIS